MVLLTVLISVAVLVVGLDISSQHKLDSYKDIQVLISNGKHFTLSVGVKIRLNITAVCVSDELHLYRHTHTHTI